MDGGEVNLLRKLAVYIKMSERSYERRKGYVKKS